MANKTYKYKGITFEVILPKKIIKDLTGEKLFNKILGEDQVALFLACESESGEYRLRNGDDKIIVHIEYKINAKEYEKSLGCDAVEKEGEQ